MAEKETIMKLKVDLQCEKCYKKVKKVLCKFPQIRDQAYLVKENLVVIKVVCCNPEKIMDKICSKGCGVIKTIEIVEPPKPKPPQEKPKEESTEKKGTEKTKEDDKKKDEKPPDDKPRAEPPKATPKPHPVPMPVPIPCPPPGPIPIGVCCVECSEGRPGGPCFQGYGRPPICHCGCYGRPVYDCYGGPRPYYACRCDLYFGEENASGCSIM